MRASLAASLFSLAGTAACVGQGVEGDTLQSCMDGADGDGDGAIDCADPDCLGYAICLSDTGSSVAEPTDPEVAEEPWASLPALVVNEFMASNATAVEDTGTAGSHPDWVEIHNTTGGEQCLAGWSITDDLADPLKHVFLEGPCVGPGGFLVLWADDDVEEGWAHVGFNLDRDGESIGLYDPDGGAATELSYGRQRPDVSAARTQDAGSSWAFDESPSPGSGNAP